MSGITPGPWHFDGAAMVTAGTEVIAVVHRSADARLIAAAPEMVDLLDDALLELSLASGILEPNNGHVEALIERINKFFKQLKGEEDEE